MSASRNSIGQFAKRRTPPSDLEFRAPDCPFCDKETDCDGDSFLCYACGASWSMNGTGGEWDEPDAIACPSVIEWHNTDRLSAEHEAIRHMADQCILPDDHGGNHRGDDPWRKWRDDDPRIVSRRMAS